LRVSLSLISSPSAKVSQQKSLPAGKVEKCGKERG